jgi:uncharacterized protein YaiI (UPF0178 family)
MRIWIDADACPGAVKEIVIKAALKREIPAVFVANKDLWLPASPLLSAVRVELGADVVDRHIIAEAASGDLAITQDIPLAAQLVPMGLAVISPYGTLFSPENIGDRIGLRDFMQDMRDAGLVTGGPKPFGDKEKRRFANAFDQTLTRLLGGKPR